MAGVACEIISASWPAPLAQWGRKLLPDQKRRQLMRPTSDLPLPPMDHPYSLSRANHRPSHFSLLLERKTQSSDRKKKQQMNANAYLLLDETLPRFVEDTNRKIPASVVQSDVILTDAQTWCKCNADGVISNC